MLRSLICAAISISTLGSTALMADVITLREGLSGYTGTRDDSAKKDGSYAYENLNDDLYAYSPIYGSNLGTVVGFDVSAVPAGATINSATLAMTFSVGNFLSGAQNTWDIKNPGAQWIEGQVSFHFAQNTGPGVKWEASDTDIFGAGYAASTGITMASQPVVTSNYLSGENITGQQLSFNVTSMVDGWVNTAQENRGFAIIHAAGATGGNIRWAGQANATEAWRPTLVIDYTPVPEPAALSLLGLGALALRRRK